MGEEGTKEALKVLRESSEYGAGMFPDDDGESGQEDCMTVGDKIVLERARKKRRHIQLEAVQDSSSLGQTGATMLTRYNHAHGPALEPETVMQNGDRFYF